MILILKEHINISAFPVSSSRISTIAKFSFQTEETGRDECIPSFKIAIYSIHSFTWQQLVISIQKYSNKKYPHIFLQVGRIFPNVVLECTRNQTHDKYRLNI